MRPIGGLKLDNPFIAAPLAGVTDVATRTIFRKMGAGLVCSEMISCKGLLYKNQKTLDMLAVGPEERPVSLQIFGSDPEIMAEATRRMNSCPNDIIDINMGCPVPKVVKNGEGSALLKDPELISKIVSAVVQASEKPVTVKIRTGWDAQHINCLEVAQRIQEAGAAAVALHGRTREQYYSGQANWEAIRQVAQALKIPVIGNGDVFSGQDAVRMMEETGCDYVMIGRGMLGNPWIFKQAIAAWKGQPIPKAPSREELADMMRTHLLALVEDKGEHRAVLEMRKHFGWYTKGQPASAKFRSKVNTCFSKDEMLALIDSF